MASEEGEFDNFTFINKHNLSDIDMSKQSHVRPSTELILEKSFRKMRSRTDADGEQSSNVSSNEEQAEGRARTDSQQAGAAETVNHSRQTDSVLLDGASAGGQSMFA